MAQDKGTGTRSLDRAQARRMRAIQERDKRRKAAAEEQERKRRERDARVQARRKGETIPSRKRESDPVVRAAVEGRAKPNPAFLPPSTERKLRSAGVLPAREFPVDLGKTARNFAGQVKDIPASVGPALVGIGRAVGTDIKNFPGDSLAGRKPFRHTEKDVVRPIASDVKYLATPGPVVLRYDKGGRKVYRAKNGGETHDPKLAASGILKKFQERPLDYALIGRGAGLGAGKVAAKAGEKGLLGEKGKTLGQAGTRELETRTGRKFQTPTSRNPVRRAEQELTRKITTGATRAVETKLGRELPVVGEHARAVRLGAKQKRRGEQAQISRNKRPFQEAFRGVKPAGRIAIVLRAKGVKPSELTEFVQNQLADAEARQAKQTVNTDPAEVRRVRGEITDHKRMLRVISKTSDEVFDSVPSDPKLSAAFQAARSLSDTTGDILEALDKLDPIAREMRPYLTARVVGGARYVPPGQANRELRPLARTERKLDAEAERVKRKIKRTAKQMDDALLAPTMGREAQANAAALQASATRAKLADTIEKAERRVARAAETLTFAQVRVAEGKGSSLDVVQRTKQLRDAERVLADARKELDRARSEAPKLAREQEFASAQTATAVAGARQNQTRALRQHEETLGRVNRQRQSVRNEQAQTRDAADGFRGGPDIETLKNELVDVFHHPDIGPKLRDGAVPQRMSGRVPPKAPSSTKRNKAIRLSASRWLPAPEAWTDGYVKAIGYAHALERGELAMSIARPLDEAGEADKGWYYVNLDGVDVSRPAKERTELAAQMDELLGGDGDIEAMVRERVASSNPSDVKGWIERAQAEGKPAPRIGQISPEDYRNIFGEFSPANKVVRMLLDNPTNFWRTLTLTYRPAWVVNNFVGQTLLYAINNSTPGGVKAYAMAALDEARRNDDRYFPADLRFGLFEAESPKASLPGTGTVSASASSALNAGIAVERAMRSKIQAFNAATSDNVPRRAAFYNLSNQERKFLNRIEGTNRTLDEFLNDLKAAAEDPVNGDKKLRETHDRLVQEVLDQLIDFNDLSVAERRVIRRVIPFYSWIKGITKATGRLAMDSPLKAEMFAIAGQTVGDDTIQKLVGRGAEILEGFAPFDVRDTELGRVATGWTTGGINPYATVGQVAGYAGDVVAGEGDIMDNPALTVGPVLKSVGETAFRRDLFSGKQLEGSRLKILGQRLLKSFPQVNTAENVMFPREPVDGNGRPRLTVPGQGIKVPGTNVIVPTEILNYAGIPVRAKNLDAAESIAETEHRKQIGPQKREHRKVFARRQEYFEAAKKHMPEALEDGKLPKKLRTAFNIEAERQGLYAKASDGLKAGTVEYHMARYQADLTLPVKHGMVKKESAAAVLERAKTATLDELKDARSEISERYYQGKGGQLYYIGHARKALKEKGAVVE